ncbi:MAG: energy transducer TonB [Pseudomonadota bacterium]
MMHESAFHKEDKIGLLVALALHVLLALALVLQMFFTPQPFPMPQRVSVSLASEVSLEASAPNPALESRAAIAPTLSDEVEAPTPDVDVPEPEEATSQPISPPAPQPASRAPAPRTPTARPSEAPRREVSPPARPANRGSGSRIGDNFLEGQGSSTTSDNATAPAANFGRRERAALASAITRQLRPHWNAPSGVEAELLVSIVSWQLNPDGTLKGRPTCRTQPGSITAGNRPQASLHCERAIRAVQLAAPFNLPEQFYSRWDDLEWQFDRRL